MISIQPNPKTAGTTPRPPRILLSGDNTRTAHILHDALVDRGFRVQLAPGYLELENIWHRQRHPMVLLEVSGPQAVEAAVHTALRLKRQDRKQFVGYIADPVLQTSGLAGDAVFPRDSDRLAKALRQHLGLTVQS